MKLTTEIFKELINPNSRLSWLNNVLTSEIWSFENYKSKNPIDYLRDGESSVNELEQIIASSASGIYDEIIAETKNNDLLPLISSKNNAIVIFDGLSLRELPIILSLSEKSQYKILKAKTSFSALPSETIDFIDQKLDIGKVAPSQLQSRKELKERNIKVYYFDSPAQRYMIEDEDKTLMLWSSFPDQTYNDSGARFIQHFENNKILLEEAWKNTVQQIPAGKKIIITSDHGYIFFGPGCAFIRGQEEVRSLNQYFGTDRHKYLKDKENLLNHPDICYLDEKKLCLIKGRVQTHPPGQTGTKLYKHGGLSLMECIVPLITLGR